VISATGPSRSTRRSSVIRAAGRHGEAPVAEVLVELLAPPLGAPALLGQIVEALALLAAAPVEQDADLLGAHQLLRQEVVEVGLRAGHDEEVAELGHLLFSLLLPRAHVQLVEDLLGRPAPPRGRRLVARQEVERAQARLARRYERLQPELLGQPHRGRIPLARVRDVRPRAVRGEVAEHLQSLGLVAALAALARELERLARRLARPRHVAGGEEALGQVDEPRGEIRADSQLAAERDALLQEAEPFDDVTHADEGQAE